MGFDFNKFKAINAKAKENINEFHPIELTERNVEAIFNRCLKTDKTVKELDKPLYIIDMRTVNPDGLLFDQDVVDANKKTIQYLIGQLKAIHEFESGPISIDIKDIFFNYTNHAWGTSNDRKRSREALIKLCHLGCVIGAFTGIFIKNKEYHLNTLESHYTSTLSPRDPNFPAWWEAHKAEWEG